MQDLATKFANMTIQSDFIFKKVISRKRIYKHLLEELLQIEIADINYIEAEKTLEPEYTSRGIRLDIIVADDKNTHYNLEMQVKNKKNPQTKAFFLYVGLFMKPLMQLLGFIQVYQRGMAGFKRFYELLQEKPEIVDAPDAKICPPCKGNISFDNVSFAYADGRPVIRNLSLNLAAGETVAFVGATGAGKTTIASLLLRFYEPQSGRILLDGCDIREFTQESLRRQIGLVQQDVFLFGDSVRYNIAYAKPDATVDEVQTAAKAAAADEFIRKLPAGYDTEVGERGVKLSGGQKQRLAIARVFLKNPPVVVLDEATSALDNITEQQIQKELDELAVGRTTLIIAHRLSTIRHADKIVVLDEGAVAECGSHEELLARKGHYYDLYQKD
jgi:ATP-binding cassette, subfamily B, bacterial